MMNGVESAIKAIDEQIAVITAVIEETEATMAALQALREKGEALVPIGAGILIPAKMGGEKVLVNVGANVFVERAIEDAIKTLQEKKEKLRQSLETMRKRRNEILTKVQQKQ